MAKPDKHDAKIDGVTDRESADKFLVDFLPKFDAWIKAAHLR
jgi:hypothetical protein